MVLQYWTNCPPLHHFNVQTHHTTPHHSTNQVWLILDGMVLDVGRWLPEHPGGATIIPKQSLNCDCARFFEVGGDALLWVGVRVCA